MTVADLLRGLLLASANDAAATLAARVGGLAAAPFVALMNRRARELGLTHTHYANPIGLDDAGQLLERRDLVKLTLILRRNAFFRAATDLPRATLRTGAHPRTIVNRNTARARGARGQRRQDRPHARRPATSSSARPRKDGVTVISRRPRRARARRRATRTRWRSSATAWAAITASRRCARATAVRQRQAGRTATSAARARGGAHRRAHRAPRRAPARSACSTFPSELDGPLPAGIAGGDDRGPLARADVARVPLVTRRRDRARPPCWQRGDDLARPHAGGRDPERARAR